MPRQQTITPESHQRLEQILPALSCHGIFIKLIGSPKRDTCAKAKFTK
jgi:hypothetical protein